MDYNIIEIIVPYLIAVMIAFIVIIIYAVLMIDIKLKMMVKHFGTLLQMLDEKFSTEESQKEDAS